jgi:TonB family protein
VGAWYRMQAIPASQAHDQTRLQQVNATALPDSQPAPKPATIGENPNASAPLATVAPATEASGTAVAPTSIVAVVPAHIRVPVPTSIATPKRVIRVPHATSSLNLRLSGPDRSISGIQASRAPLRFAYPDYSDVRARGVVSLTAAVDSEGVVRNVRVISGNRALAAAAVQAVHRWRYRPYLKDGQPVATETNIVISYFSQDAISMSFPPSIPASR